MPYRAGFWIRTLAAAIDALAMLLIGVGAVSAALAVLEVASLEIPETAAAAFVYAVWLAYTSMEIWFAATPGKMPFRLRVSNADGLPADFWRLFLRWSTKWSWLFLSVLFLLTDWPPVYLLAGFISLVVVIGCFFAANDDRLTWHDRWARTAVYCMPRRHQAFDTIVPPTPPPLPPSNP